MASNANRRTVGAGIAASVIAALLLSSFTATAVNQQDPIGDVLWPPSEYATLDSLEELARSLFLDQEPIVVGSGPNPQYVFEPVNETHLKIQIDGQTFLQAHLPEESTNDRYLTVLPHQLTPVAHIIPPKRLGGDVLRLGGPPTQLNVSGDTISERSRDLINRLGLPEFGFESGSQERYTGLANLGTGYTFYRPYLSPLVDCPPDQDESCPEPILRFSCDDCQLRIWRIFPAPGDELTELVEGQITVQSNTNTLWTVEDAEDRFVWISLPPAIDLDESAVVNPLDARDQVLMFLKQEGYELPERLGRDDIDETIIRFGFEDTTFTQISASYEWRAPVLNETDPCGETALIVDQDAVSGDILTIEKSPTCVDDQNTGETIDPDQGEAPAESRGPDRTEQPQPTSWPGALAVVASVGLALAWRRSKRG